MIGHLLDNAENSTADRITEKAFRPAASRPRSSLCHPGSMWPDAAHQG
jgi:hypothetical protein